MAAPRSRSSAALSRKGSRTGRGLTPEKIIEAATRICDEESIEALTIRRLASDLGVGAMTLYGYFRNKEEILDGIADHILGQLELPPAEETSPAVVVRSLSWAFLRMMRQHPSIVRLFTTRVTTSMDSMRRAFDSVIGRLRAVGFTDMDAVRAYGLIVQYTLGFASYQAPRSWGKPDDSGLAELQRQRKHFYASLPLEQFPNMVELATEVTNLPTDGQFVFGLDCLIAGLLTQAGIADPASPKTTRQQHKTEGDG
jgi:AcrR family transcriptional regulator